MQFYCYSWLGRGSMFVLSEAQARTLLNIAESPARLSGALVDVGAGDGEVSRRFAPLFTTQCATEISASMRKALVYKGFTYVFIFDTKYLLNFVFNFKRHQRALQFCCKLKFN